MMGILSPRYIAGTHGNDFFIVFCIGLLLLSFDHQRRDENSRIDEVIRSLPLSNLDLIGGRLIGNIVVIGVPMLGFLFLMVSYGVIAEYFSFKFGTLIEPLSVFSFIFLDAILNFVFFGSLVVLLALVMKSRFLALLISILVLFGFFWFVIGYRLMCLVLCNLFQEAPYFPLNSPLRSSLARLCAIELPSYCLLRDSFLLRLRSLGERQPQSRRRC